MQSWGFPKLEEFNTFDNIYAADIFLNLGEQIVFVFVLGDGDDNEAQISPIWSLQFILSSNVSQIVFGGSFQR